MASYTRQSSFADGDTITAALFNNEFNQLVNAFHNSTGHKHDGTTAEGPVIGLIGDAGETSPNNKVLIDTTNNYIEFYVEVSSSPVQQLYIADGAIVPVTDSDVDLGTTSLRFKDTYTDTVTTTGNVSVGGNLTVTGNATISGNLTFGDADTDSINLAAEIDSDIIPNTDGTYDLGSSTKEWQDLYIDGTANIDSLVADTADINGGTIDGSTIATSDITVGSGKTLDVSAGTLTLADDQISGDKVEGGTIAATTITTLASTTGNVTNVNATTVDTTNIEVTNIKAKDGTAAGSIADSTGVVTLASSVLTTTDINGGTIDGTTIATSDITVGAGKTLDVSAGTLTLADNQISGDKVEGGTIAATTITDLTFGSLNDGTITVTAFVDEDDMTSDSATLVPTQQSVKAYVDSQVTAQDLDFQGDSGGALSIDLDSETLTVAGGTGIDTSGATNTLTVAIDSTVATLTGSQTLTNKTLTSPVLNTGVSGTAILDEDDMSSNSATQLATQQSIKAYVDARILTEDTLAELNDTNITSPADASLLFYDTSTSMWIDNVVSGDITIADTGVATIASGAVDNAMLANSTVSYGGVSLALGASDATPAFDLTDATNYPTSSLSGTITNAQLAGSIANAKLANSSISIAAGSSATDVSLGGTVTFAGTTNEIDVSESSGTVTYGLPSNVTIGSNLTVTADLIVDTNSLKVDSTNNRVGILNASPDVSLDIGSATDAIHVPSGTTAQRPTGANGYFRYNTEDAQFEGYADGAWGAIAGSGSSGSAIEPQIFAGDGSTVNFTLTSAPTSENNLWVFIDGAFQAQNTYSVSGTTLTFSTAPANTRVVTVYHARSSISGSNMIVDTMTGDNSDTTLTLSVAPVSENNVQVYFDGVYQSKANYSISGTTLTFSTAPATGVAVEAITHTQTTINEPAANTVTSSKLSGDLTTPGNLTVTGTGTFSSNVTALTSFNSTTGNDLRLNAGSANRDIFMQVNGTTHMTVQGSSGSVGIGKTPNRSRKLEVAGTMNLDDGSEYEWGDGSISIGGNSSTDVMTFATASAERMRIDSAGNLLVGTTSTLGASAAGTTHITGGSNSTSEVPLYLRNPNSTSGRYWKTGPTNNAGYVVYNNANTGVYITYGNTSWTSNSDESLKENISDVGSVIDKVKDYRCVNYSLKSQNADTANKVGFIAQDWENDFPNVVDKNDEGILGMKYTETIPVLLKAIQEQQALIEAQATTITDLTTRIETLENA